MKYLRLLFLPFLISAYGPANAANPAEAKTIGCVIRDARAIQLFATLRKTGIGSTLSEDTRASYTVFAPTDAAFKKLPKGTVDTLLDPRNDDRLEEVFGFHVKEVSGSTNIHREIFSPSDDDKAVRIRRLQK